MSVPIVNEWLYMPTKSFISLWKQHLIFVPRWVTSTLKIREEWINSAKSFITSEWEKEPNLDRNILIVMALLSDVFSFGIN